MSAPLTAQRYGEAYVLARGDDEKAEIEAASFLQLLKDEELKSFFASPVFSKAEKVKILEKLVEKKAITPLLSTFVKVILDHGRGFYLASMMEAVVEVAERRQNVHLGYCYTAFELTDKQKKSLEIRLQKRFGGRVKLKYIEDPGLIGGLRVFVDDTLIDGSLRSQAEALRQQILEGR